MVKQSYRVRPVAIIIILSAISLSHPSILQSASAGTRTGPIEAALSWLTSHQQSDGSFGSLTELQTAPAANALWIRNGNSPSVESAYNWLRNRMQNSTTWFWGSFGEADVPGEVLYSFTASRHGLNLSFVTGKLLSFQEPNGGFRGYAPSGQAVTSSVDTAMALLGLINAGTIPASNRQSAINYLFTLQNADGSFNLTRTVASDPLYSLGPEPISITALVTIVLKHASYTANESHVSAALGYLTVSRGQNFNGHVYAAAISALAFTGYGRAGDATVAVNYLISHQNADGGFRDTVRFSPSSNALDTGWAAIALQLGGLVGDVNVDGIVNILDLATIGVAFGATAESPKWSPRADLDGNGTVNIIDLAMCGVNFGKTADSL